MSTTKHTPGPYKVESCEVHPHHYIRQTSTGKHIASVTDHHDGTDAATAQLLAAAPDELLEALQGVMRWWMETPAIVNGDDALEMPASVFDPAIAALAKACRGGDTMNYYEQELAKIDFTGRHGPAHIIVGCDGRVTKSLSLNPESAAALIGKLVEVFMVNRPASEPIQATPEAIAARYNVKLGRDTNGNKVVRVSQPVSERGFTIQTNGNLPDTDRNGVTEKTYTEIQDYVGRHGTHRQRQIVLGVV